MRRHGVILQMIFPLKEVERNVRQVRDDSFQHFLTDVIVEMTDVDVEVKDVKLKRVRRSEVLKLTVRELTEGAGRAFCPLRK